MISAISMLAAILRREVWETRIEEERATLESTYYHQDEGTHQNCWLLSVPINLRPFQLNRDLMSRESSNREAIDFIKKTMTKTNRREQCGSHY